MNTFGYLKKIFNSFDFMGNRIKRLRVDTPEKFVDDVHSNESHPANPQYRENLEGHTPDKISADIGKGPSSKYNEVDYERYKDFVANKDYVDKRTTYKSERARNQEEGKNNSTNTVPSLSDTLAGMPGSEKKNNVRIKRTPSQFPWMTGVFGKPHEEVLDELLYPRIPYTYKYPVIQNINIRTNELLVECLESNIKTNKFTVMQNVANDIFFEIFIDNGDWFNTNNASIVFIRSNGVENICDSGAFDVQSGPTHPVFNLRNVIIHDDVVRVEFRQTYNSHNTHYDTWGYISNPALPTYRMIVDITDEFFKQCYPWNLKTKQSANDVYDDKTNDFNKIHVAAKTVSNKYFKVSNPLDENYYLECLIYDNATNQLLNTTIINQEEITSTGEVIYNFGYYPNSVYIKFRPIPLTISERFVQGD